MFADIALLATNIRLMFINIRPFSLGIYLLLA